jgi:hypothetical protein
MAGRLHKVGARESKQKPRVEYLPRIIAPGAHLMRIYKFAPYSSLAAR